MSATPHHLPAQEPVGTPPGPWREFWTAFSANRGAVLGLLVIVGLLLVAVSTLR